MTKEGISFQAILLAFGLGVALVALLAPLSDPIVRLVFQRQSFDPSAATFVATLLRYCIFGAPVYLMRDVAVRVFYVLGTHVPRCVTTSGPINERSILLFRHILPEQGRAKFRSG
jgi:hypothetical protein